MISQAYVIWDLSEERITTSIKTLKGTALSEPCQEKLDMSHNALKGIIVELSSSNKYQNEEDPLMFKRSIEELKDVFKHLFEAYMIQRGIGVEGDNIDDLRDEFYKDVQRRRGSSTFIPQAYPPITCLVRLVRNCHHAAVGTTDHITKKRGFGNVYTLCSAFILAIYAYIEILEAWISTEGTR